MSRGPKRLAKVGLDAHPDAVLLSRLIHSHRNGRPDIEEMNHLAARLQPLLTTQRPPAGRLPSWFLPTVMSTLLVASAGWVVSRTNQDLSRSGATATAEAPPVQSERATPQEAPTAIVAPPAEPQVTALSVHALPDLAPPAPPERANHASAGDPRRAAKSTSAAPAACDDVELIERAGAELRSGQAARALATTQRHEERCADGLLAQERERIAIEALAVVGRLDEARKRASTFEERYSSSPHVRRIRQVVGTVRE